MPAKANEGTKKFNPSLKGVFTNKNFKGRDDSDAIFIKITPENYKTLMDNVRVGSALVVRYNTKTEYGASYFVDILPPQEGGTKSKAAAASELD